MSPHSITLIATLLLVFASALAGGLIAHTFRQPVLLGYIAFGVLFGNVFHRFIDELFVTTIAESGVTLLLFTLGVEFSFHRLRKILGFVSWAAIAQLLLSIFIFLLLFLLLGFSFLPALLIALAASLSSTAILIKVLSEKGELETTPGEVAIGWSVVQDLAVVPIMLLLPAVVSVETAGTATFVQAIAAIAGSLLKAGAALFLVIVLGKRAIPRLLNAVSKIGSREIFLLMVVGIVFVAALVTYALGLSAALGAFIAGLLIAETSQNHAIFAEVRPLRDLFAVVFFVSLGLVLPVSQVVYQLPLIATIALVILSVKGFLIFGLGRFLGHHRKTAFLVALGLLSMSEFGFIIAKEGVVLGALTQSEYVFLVAVAFTTILISAPLFSAQHAVYYWFYHSLGRILPKLFPTKLELSPNREELTLENHIVICGYGRVGKYIGRALDMAQIPYVVVDYNHTTVADLKAKGIMVVYGDPADKDVLDYAQVDYAKAVIIAIPDRHTQEMIIGNAQTLNKRIKIICRTHHEEDQRRLKSLGVQTIVQPEFEAALAVVNKVLPDFGVSADDLAGKISRLKIEHGLG